MMLGFLRCLNPRLPAEGGSKNNSIRLKSEVWCSTTIPKKYYGNSGVNQFLYKFEAIF
jgi:hypothetical protein